MEDLVLTINNKEFKAEFDKNDASMVYINGKPHKVELMKKYGSDVFSFIVNKKLKQIALDLGSDEHSRVEMDGMSFDIQITDDTRRLLRKYIQSSASVAGAVGANIKAPMPGMVIKLLVAEKDAVNKGDSLVIVEAMKMENALKATAPGIVKKIHIKEGLAVEKDQLLIELET